MHGICVFLILFLPETLSLTETQNFWLIADYNEIKMVAMDTEDHQEYAVVTGNRYASSFSAIAYDTANDIIYFSDVNRYGGQLFWMNNNFARGNTYT